MLIYQYLIRLMFVLPAGSLKSIFPVPISKKMETHFGMSPHVFSLCKHYFNYYCVHVNVYCIFSNRSSIPYKFKPQFDGHQIFSCFQSYFPIFDLACVFSHFSFESFTFGIDDKTLMFTVYCQCY